MMTEMRRLFEEIKSHYSNAELSPDWFKIIIPYSSIIPYSVNNPIKGCSIERHGGIISEYKLYIRIQEQSLNKEKGVLWVDPDSGKNCTHPKMKAQSLETYKIHQIIRDFYTPNSIRFIRSLAND